MSDDKTSTSTLPLHFQGHQIRSYMDEKGMMWWVAQDAATVLDIKNIHTTLQRFPWYEKDAIHSMDSMGREQHFITLNTPGLFRLIMRSRKPEAEAFQHWVYHDILLSVFRTGTYTIPQPPHVLTPTGKLPAPVPPIKEHAEVSWHLAAVWTLLRTSGEVLTNHEIAQRTGIAKRTARAHTKYLLQLGVIDLHETFPRHLYQLAELAEKRNAAVYQRLTRLAELIQARQQV